MERKLLIVSDRKNLKETDDLSNETQYVITNSKGALSCSLDKEAFLKETQGKSVLILIHGYNCEFDETLSAYNTILDKIESAYDQVICYLWPGGDSRFEYLGARSRVMQELDTRLAHLLDHLKTKANSVDIVAHSMGCRLTLETLSEKKSKARYVHLMGAAVDNEAIGSGHKYASATQQCERLFVFHSSQDSVLKYAYVLGDWDRALGYLGPQNLQSLSQNVSVVDCSSQVHGHSDYKNSHFVFDKVRSAAASGAASHI